MPLGKRGHLRWLKKKIAISCVTCRLTDINHMREQMLDEDPAKREAWSAESSALIYTTGTLKLHIIQTSRSKRKTKITKCSSLLERNIK